jgi:hypothetical protein
MGVVYEGWDDANADFERAERAFHHAFALNPTHCCHTLRAEAKNLPHLFGGRYRIANSVGAHASSVYTQDGRRQKAQTLAVIGSVRLD